MFNIKTIGIAFSILALVGLIGALLAGPAFARPPDSKHEKMTMCHYSEAEFVLEGEFAGDLIDGTDAWHIVDVSNDSVDKHIANHSDPDGDVADFVIFDNDGGVTADDCQDLIDTNPVV